MDAEVEEMTRDRRNNILVHGLPVQVTVKARNFKFSLIRNFLCLTLTIAFS